MPTWRGFLIRALISSLIAVFIGVLAATPPAPTEILIQQAPQPALGETEHERVLARP